MTETIEKAFQDALDAGKINGGVICATDSQGRFTYDKTFGERTLLSGEKKPVQTDDVLFMASATKLIATISALQCVEDGLISLDGDLSTVAPELSNKPILKGWSEDGETPITETATKPITLKLLLTHSAGITYHFLNPEIMKWTKKFDDLKEGQRRPVEESFKYPLSYEPGTSWMYSNGIDWAGRIVERLTGMTLGEHMQKRIFDPLSINSAQFYPVTREDLRSRMVDLNPEDPGGLGNAVVGGAAYMNERSQGDFGGHGIFMAASDYVKVLKSLLANDGKILKPATANEMFKNQLGPEAKEGHKAAMAGPGGIFFRVGVPEGSKAGFAFGGLVTEEDAEGWFGEGTLAWGGGLTVAWFIDRKNDLCGIASVLDKMPTDNQAPLQLKNVFRHDVYRKQAAWKDQQGA